MSNPGHTGISLLTEQLQNEIEFHRMLDDCVDYSILDMKDHTTKTKDRKRRLKFYIEPILCPYFKLPFQQTKEPIYFNCSDLKSLTDSSNLEESNDRQLGLDI